MRPLVSYHGGKQRIARLIVQEIQQIPHKNYVEPYCGGASVLYAKDLPKNPREYRECINDISDNLITFYRTAIEQSEALIRMIEGTLFSQSEHEKAGDIFSHPQEHDALERAWAYYVLSGQSYAALLDNPSWGLAFNGRNMATTWINRFNVLEKQINRIKNVHISCEDALKCIKRWDSPQTLFYIDPPYPGTQQHHYRGFSNDDWLKLVQLIDSIEGSYILSNYPHDAEPATAQKRIEIAANSSIAKDKNSDRDRTEVLWIKVG